MEQNINRVSIFRPKGLARDGTNGNMFGALDVRILAAVMVYDAECEDIEDGKVEDTVFYTAANITFMTEIAVQNFDETCPVVDMKQETEGTKEEEKENQSEKNADV